MISLKMGVIIVAAFAAGSFLAPPVQQAIAAVIATDVQCTGCVGSSDLAGSAVTAAKIKDGEVKAAEIAAGAVGSSEIATDAVGASELQGVNNLVFGECLLDTTTGVVPGELYEVLCPVSGVDGDEFAVATLRKPSNRCYEVAWATPFGGGVQIFLRNICSSTQPVPTAGIAVIVFDK